jgi:hypothetical protein
MGKRTIARMRIYRLNISDIISTSVSAAAIFSAEESCGRPPPNRNDIVMNGANFKRRAARVYIVRSLA